MKTAGLLLVTVVLTSLLSPGASVAAVNKDDLTKIVKFMMNRYDINTQVSVALNVPQSQDLNTLQDLLESADTVHETLNCNSVYVDCTMVVARPYRNVHAEVRVLKNIGSLVDNANDHFLVFYSFYSPCGRHCMNEGGKFSIIPRIKEVFPNWTQFAFVFSKVFHKTSKGDDIPPEETAEALKQLGNTVGYDNVFRCYTPNKDFKCINCFSDKEPVAQCIDS